MEEALYSQAIINIMWGRQMIPTIELQEIADALANGNRLPIRPVQETIDILNHSLNGLGFEIRRGISEDDGTSYHALCNMKADKMSQMATSFKSEELRYFTLLIKAIMTNNPSGSTVLANAINARLDDPKTKALTAREAETLIARFVDDKWLSIPERGHLAIGPRCLLELRQYIEGEYANYITECTVCTDIVFKGESCLNNACTIKLHHHCARRWFHGKARKCPSCTNPWPEAPPGWEDNEPLPPPRQFHPNAVAVD